MDDSKKNIKRPIVIGSGGFIGRHLVKTFNAQVYTHYRRAPFLLDLKAPSLESLPIKECTHAIIAAGCADINACTRLPEETHLINVKGTLELTKQCIEKGLFPVLFSTDYVFDGQAGDYTEESPLSPINVYGKQKAELEKCVTEITGGNHLILRLSKIYSTEKGSKTLIDEMVQHLIEGRPIRAAVDQVFCPLHVEDLMQCIKLLLEKGERGLFNCGGREKLSRYDLALKVAQALGVSEALVEPISLDHLEGSPRPKATALSSDKLYKTVLVNPQTIDQSIRLLTSRRKN
ncbi:MAG: SDR family oxidoreductase [Chlamydiia bacterium]|nr:SDR family oxidoreductase [Chlamydiia bacterium]